MAGHTITGTAGDDRLTAFNFNPRISCYIEGLDGVATPASTAS